MMKQGTWWIVSTTDSRWNVSGRGFVGMWGKPREVEEAIEEKKKELGNPPSDLEWGYMKD